MIPHVLTGTAFAWEPLMFTLSLDHPRRWKCRSLFVVTHAGAAGVRSSTELWQENATPAIASVANYKLFSKE